MDADDTRPIYQRGGLRALRQHGLPAAAWRSWSSSSSTPEIDELIARRATGREIRTRARRAKGFRTLAEDAISRVLLGQTSLEEISRVVDLTDRVI